MGKWIHMDHPCSFSADRADEEDMTGEDQEEDHMEEEQEVEEEGA